MPLFAVHKLTWSIPTTMTAEFDFKYGALRTPINI